MAPPPPSGRRLAVLVAGLGSSSGRASVDDIDVAALGYAGGDVVRFSYRGGTTVERPYGPADTLGDIEAAGRRLRAVLEALHARHPGIAIDVVAHSLGGMVTRAALGARAPPGVATVTTLGTPHQGADLATAAVITGGTLTGAAAQELASRVRPGGIDPTAPAVHQLAESSDFVRRLASRPLPGGVRFTSIAARADAVVASPRSWLPGAANVVVSVAGANQHAELPGAPRARREIALAVAGMPPTCQGLGDMLADLVVGEAIGTAEDLGGVAVAAAVR